MHACAMATVAEYASGLCVLSAMGVGKVRLVMAELKGRIIGGALHFIGEAVDVTGHLGGHNFQWAWASGQAAGEVV